jgi:hypothetical protein
MPRIMRYKLASKLATVAVGGATLAVAMGQLPAQAYGPPPPPPPPGGYHNVVTSQTCGPKGCVIEARIDGLLVAVTVPAGDFAKPVQITLLAPNARGIGTGIRSCWRAVGGVGIVVQINGTTYTGIFAKPFTVELSGREIRPGDRVAVWNGTSFAFIPATETGDTEEFSYKGGAKQDFAVLAPSGPGSCQPGVTRATGATRFSHQGQLSDAVLESMFFAAAGQRPAAIGVLSPEWLAARNH